MPKAWKKHTPTRRLQRTLTQYSTNIRNVNNHILFYGLMFGVTCDSPLKQGQKKNHRIRIEVPCISIGIIFYHMYRLP